MKPEITDRKDKIDSLFDESWQRIPSYLEDQLLQIPSELNVQQAIVFDKLGLFLHGILAVWILGLIYAFRDTIGFGMAHISRELINGGATISTALMNPAFMILGFGIMGFVLWRFEVDHT
ncbi:MAG: hypothetical protein K9N35_03555 [Candidatus Marinimicrobia bacterium]|nr:hypothetical protein [Candidatus Neomarinimicrobiota bacterium]